MSEATERPWIGRDTAIYMKSGRCITAVNYTASTHEEACANAELIVTAVNEHDELLAKIAELEAALAYSDELVCEYRKDGVVLNQHRAVASQ